MNKLEKKIRKILYRNYGTRDCLKIYHRQGLVLLLNYANYIDRRLIIKEPYEDRQFSFFIESLREDVDVFIDVGANIGLYSLKAAQSGYVQRVIAFEPDLRNNYQFRANILLNNFVELIGVHDCGLSNETGRVGFLQQKGNSTGKSRIGKTAPATTKDRDYKQTSIQTVRFDDMIQLKNQKLYIKMDVEGHEVNALEGMQNLLNNNRCLLQVEVFQEKMAAVRDFMTGHGYTLFQEIGDDRFFKNY